MKNLISFFIILTLTVVTTRAQSPEKMSYQAVIRNNADQLMTDQGVGMQVSILQGSAEGTAVYTERHFPETNANGLVTIEIGTGTVVEGDFTTIDWQNGPFFIKTETDLNGGANYTITGTSQLLSVPYALHAKAADNLSGTITESQVNDLQNYLTEETDPLFSGWDKNYNDLNNLPELDTDNWDEAYNWGNHATEGYLTSFVETDPTWEGSDSIQSSIGRDGAVGIGTTAPSALLHVDGTSRIANVLFEGNHVSHNVTPPPASGSGTRFMWYEGKAALRAGMVTGNNWDKDSIGDFSVAMGYDTKALGINSVALGSQTTAFGEYSTAMGYFTTASGNASTSMGRSTTASGQNSTSTGYATTASGDYSTSMGYNSIASGDYSTAMGEYTTASKEYSFAMGYNSEASGYCSTAIGYNTSASNSYAFSTGYETDASGTYSFTTGHATIASGARSFAAGVSSIASGNCSFATGGNTNASGNYATSMGNATTASGSRAFALGANSTASGNYSIVMGVGSNAGGDFSIAMGRGARANNDFAFAISLDENDGPVVGNNIFHISGATSIGGNVAWTNYSDRRLKKEVQRLNTENNLEKIMQLEGIRFRWKENDSLLNLGFIAQEAINAVPEAIRYDNLNDIYSMEYSAIIPILTEGIKEQQEIIENQQEQIESLQQQIDELKELIVK